MTFNTQWNPHYNFDDPSNLREIEAVESYDLAKDRADYATGQGVPSPWGTNNVLEARQENGVDICIKEIIVKPGFMLSLQRHRGRAELWEVTEGILTVIMDGTVQEVRAGHSITLPKGSVHCMINASEKPVVVKETQTGICREKDNIRLLDSNNRPTYPLTTPVEYQSAKIYGRIQAELFTKFKTGNPPHKAWLT